MKIYLVRHSESEDDLIDAYGGAADWKLTQEGRKTVETFAKNNKDLDFDKIYSSSLSRANDTALIINQNKQVPIEKVFDLREFNQYGVMSGLTKAQAKQIFGYLLELKKYQEMDYYKNKVFYGGEKVSELDNRVKKAFNKITNENYDKVLVVSHSGVFKSVFKNLLNCDKKVKKIADCGMAEIEYKNGEYSLVSVQDIILI